MNWAKVLIPGFLRRLDSWLLKNQPTIWRTRIHYVLFYSAIVFNLLTVAFYQFFPMTTGMVGNNLEGYRVISLIFGVFAVLFWGWEIRKFAFQGKAFLPLMTTLLIYWLGSASIGVNIWTFNKSIDFKVAALVDNSTLTADKDQMRDLNNRITSFDEKMYDYNRLAKINRNKEDKPVWGKEFNINDLIVRYGLFNNNFELQWKQHGSHGFTPTTFLNKYGVSASEVLEDIRRKTYVIDRAKRTESWTSSEDDFRDIYFLFFIGLLGLPLLGLVIANSSIVTIVSIAFAHFVLFLGVIFQARNGDVGERYIAITGVGMLLLFLLRRNWKPYRLIHLFIVALVPIAFMFYQVDNNHVYNYPRIPISVVFGLLQTLGVTILGGIGYWLYLRKTTIPQISD